MRKIESDMIAASYSNGFEFVKESLKEKTWQTVRNEYMQTFPNDFKFINMDQYYFAKGMCDALLSEVS